MRGRTLRFAQRSICSSEDSAKSRYHCSRNSTSAVVAQIVQKFGDSEDTCTTRLKGVIFEGRVPQQAEFATTLVASS